jgi:hypothetical protein
MPSEQRYRLEVSVDGGKEWEPVTRWSKDSRRVEKKLAEFEAWCAENGIDDHIHRIAEEASDAK